MVNAAGLQSLRVSQSDVIKENHARAGISTARFAKI
jgi:hypothetical protein